VRAPDLWSNRRRLRERYGRRSCYGLRAFGDTDPRRQMVLLSLAAAVFPSSNPQAAYAGTPTYDPVFYYYHPDHLGSAQLMTDRAGEVVQHYGYTPFGKESYQNNTYAFEVSSRYTGQTLDEDTGLYYYGARYYDPEFSQACNRYAYVYNNPLKFSDPTGQYPFWASAAAGAFAGAYMGAAQAVWAGGSIVMGAYIGMINGVACMTIIPTINSTSTALTSALTGNPSTSYFSSGQSDSAQLHADTQEPETTEDSFRPTYDYAQGTNPTRDGLRYAAKEVGHMALDAIGTLDPTPASDLSNAAWYASEGRWGHATASAASAAPYFGDLIGKGGRYSIGMLKYGDDAAAFVRRGAGAIDRSWKLLIEGTAHGAGPHRIRTYREAITMAKSGKYERVCLNRSLRTTTGGLTDSLMRPDVIGIRTSGTIDMVEVVSPSQTRVSQIDKVKRMQGLLGPGAGRSKVVEPH